MDLQRMQASWSTYSGRLCPEIRTLPQFYLISLFDAFNIVDPVFAEQMILLGYEL
jgi:hypothetical protein